MWEVAGSITTVMVVLIAIGAIVVTMKSPDTMKTVPEWYKRLYEKRDSVSHIFGCFGIALLPAALLLTLAWIMMGA